MAGAIALTGAGYTQDFNALMNTGSSGNNTIFANTEIVNALFWTGSAGADISSGWWANNSQAYGFAVNATSPANNSRVLSFGTLDGDSERSFGVGRQAPGGFGAQFQNDTGAKITELAIEYDGEQWYRGNGGDTLSFDFSTDATTLMGATATWTAVTDLDFISPNSLGVWGNGDGNLAANREDDIAHTITGLNIAAGETFFVRWGVATAQDNSLAIDNFSIQAIPEPATLGLIGLFGLSILVSR